MRAWTYSYITYILYIFITCSSIIQTYSELKLVRQLRSTSMAK